MTRLSERRSDIRTNYKSPARVEYSKGIIYKARIVNYSNDGLYIETDWPLQAGTEIYIEMEKSPYASSTFDFLDRRQSVILWQTVLKDSFYTYGYGIKYIRNFEEKIPQISVITLERFRKRFSSLIMSFLNLPTKSVMVMADKLFRLESIEDIVAAKIPAITRPTTPVGRKSRMK